MKPMMNRLKLRFILIFIISIFSKCQNVSDNMQLSSKATSNLKYLLSTDEYLFVKTKNSFSVTVPKNKLDNDLLRELGASNVALIMYEEMAENNTYLEYKTTFNITFSDINKTYSYNLKDLSNILDGKDIVDKVIGGLKNQKKNLANDFDCNELNFLLNEPNIEWQKIEDFGLDGFQRIRREFCNEVRDIILYRIFILPQKVELWFYFDKNKNKILKIKKNDGGEI